MVGARARSLYDAQAKARMAQGGGDRKSGPENLPDPVKGQADARDAAGKAVGVSGKTIDYATRVLKFAPHEGSGDGEASTTLERLSLADVLGVHRGDRAVLRGVFPLTGNGC